MKRTNIIKLILLHSLLIFLLFFASSVTLINQNQLRNNTTIGTMDYEINLMTSATPRVVLTHPTFYNPKTIDISANGKLVVVGEYPPNPCNLTLLDINGPRWTYEVSFGIEEAVISADGNYMVCVDSQNNVTLFNKAGFLDNFTLSLSPKRVSISQTGLYFVVGDYFGNIMLFNRSNPQPNKINHMWTYDTGADINSVAISADGQYFVSGDDNDNITLRNVT